jgi:hypothetical protein
MTVLAAVALAAPAPARGQEFAAAGSVGAAWTDNLFGMRSREWDASILPALRVGLDFADVWTLQYDGAAEVFARHPDLTSHDHALTLQVNPAFGPGGRNEYLLAATVETLRNQDAYEALNFVGARLGVAVNLEPTDWFAWKVAADVRYRRFYDDTQSDALDVLSSTEARFTFATRTTLSPRVAYGFRYNAGLKGSGQGRPDRDNHQVDVGLHVSQGLWETAGLQADYSYRYLVAASRILPRQLTQTQFAFLTTDFLAGGHRAYLKFKQVLPRGFSLSAGVEFRTLLYRGWPATDLAGNLKGVDREDRKLIPSANLGWSRSFAQVGLNITLSYAWARQWSNSADYDAQAHQVTLGVGVEY